MMAVGLGPRAGALYGRRSAAYRPGVRRLLVHPAVFAAVLSACGPKVLDTEGDAASESGASEGDTTGATGGGSTGGSTGGAACEGLADVTPSPAVTVTLRNGGAEPVFLVRAQGCDFVDPLAIAGPGDTPVNWSQGSCEFTCGEAMSGFCSCPAFCAQDSVMMLAPGGTYMIPWSGAVYEATDAPMACVAAGGCPTSCLRKLQAPSGTYTLTSVGGSEVAGCLDPNNCTCTPNGEGWCEIGATGVGGAPRQASAMLNYPGTAIDVVF